MSKLRIPMSKLRITIHRGSHQIGGNCVEIASDSTRLIVDAGLPLDFTSPAAPLPVPGLFDDGPPVAAILLSHAHPDHSGLLPLVRPEIPVCLTRGTSKMLRAGKIFAQGPRVPVERQRIVEPGKRFEIGDCAVTALSVDHSIFGAVAWLIERGDTCVLYSGDLRMHGRKPGMTRALVKAVAARPLDALLLEGTHLSRDARSPCVKESQLETVIVGLLRDAPSLALAMFSPQNLDRLVTFYKATRLAGRVFVVDLYAAFIMHLLHSQVKIPLPTAEAGMRVFFPTIRPRNLSKIEHLFTASRIELGEITADPRRFLMLARPSMLKGDFANRLPAKTRALYSQWSGYRERSNQVEFEHALAVCGGGLIECHTSGHARVADLVKLIGDLAPRCIIPIHTERPERLRELVPNVRIAHDGEAIEI